MVEWSEKIGLQRCERSMKKATMTKNFDDLKFKSIHASIMPPKCSN